MDKKERKPLGVIELANGIKQVMPMNDFFLSYTFSKKENWETLRSIHNILIEFCKILHKEKAEDLSLITDEIIVESQYEYFLDENRNKRQDTLLREADKNLTFIEFQNKAYAKPLITIRGIEYLAFGINAAGSEKLANQIWILGEHHRELLGEEIFENYQLIGQFSKRTFPNKSSIMYISLEKLAKTDSTAGELARFLLGIELEPKSEDVKKIAKRFNQTFDSLQDDKEAKHKMSNVEYIRGQGIEEGIEKGIEQGIEQGIERGIERGIEQSMIVVARKLLRDGEPIEKIIRLTELTRERIEELRE